MLKVVTILTRVISVRDKVCTSSLTQDEQCAGWWSPALPRLYPSANPHAERA